MKRYPISPFGGLPIRYVHENRAGLYGTNFRVRTLTNLAALKHFGGPNYQAANDKGPVQLVRPLTVA